MANFHQKLHTRSDQLWKVNDSYEKFSASKLFRYKIVLKNMYLNDPKSKFFFHLKSNLPRYKRFKTYYTNSNFLYEKNSDYKSTFKLCNHILHLKMYLLIYGRYKILYKLKSFFHFNTYLHLFTNFCYKICVITSGSNFSTV